MSEIRIIKKYPNRRLYDTAISSYITLEDTRKLILEGMSIQVLDARTKQDITHATLLQILVDQEDKRTPLFSNNALQLLIRCYGHAVADKVTHALSQACESVSDELAKTEPVKSTPVHNVNKLASWKPLQEKWTQQSKITSQEDEKGSAEVEQNI